MVHLVRPSEEGDAACVEDLSRWLERIDRHTNGVNGLFLDGHVAFFSYSTAPDNCDMILADDQISSFNCEIP